ncbi:MULTISPECIES: DUF3592 domain-containing protein [unclassified Actinomadura]|uniref:DUF3592 domain-containing protein n=1 Tax=unclassified Actinomadura TaxID=2626254 RepID=UPI0011EEA9FD|nr:DUF3592 domain-containing protein [Actinomadura sp. K4S16]
MGVVVACLITLLALGLVCSVPVFLVGRLRFLGRAERTRGRVVSRVLDHDGTGASNPVLEVRYRAADGREYTFEQKTTQTWKVGEVVEVLYDSARPARAYLKFGVAYVLAMAVFMLALGLGLGFLAVQMWRALV